MVKKSPALSRLPRTYGWLSLSNIAFAPETVGHIALPLVNGWSAYAGVFGNPDYTVSLMFLKGSAWSGAGLSKLFEGSSMPYMGQRASHVPRQTTLMQDSSAKMIRKTSEIKLINVKLFHEALLQAPS